MQIRRHQDFVRHVVSSHLALDVTKTAIEFLIKQKTAKTYSDATDTAGSEVVQRNPRSGIDPRHLPGVGRYVSRYP